MKQVLLVDDSIFIREAVSEIFAAGGEFSLVGYAKSGEEAIALYEKLQPDIVLMDIIMPGMDGIDTLKLLRERWPEIRVVIGSSLAYDETVEMAEQAGARSVVFKPFDAEHLLAALAKAAAE